MVKLTLDRKWFITDLAFNKTKELLLKSEKEVSGDMEDWRGRLDFHLSNLKDVTFQITTKSKLGIYFPQGTKYETYLEMVKPYLVKVDGTPANILSEIETRGQLKKLDFGFFEWLDHRAERKRKEKNIEYRKTLAVAEQMSELMKKKWGVDVEIDSLLQKLKRISKEEA